MGNDDSDASAEKLQNIITPLIANLGTDILKQLLKSALSKIASTNSVKQTPEGEVALHPTKEESDLAQNENSGAKVKASGAEDSTSGQNGELKGNETDASAATEESTAAEAGASASRTKAGASDIETKSLKMM